MPEEQDVKKPPGAARRWIRRVGLALLILFALLAAFHRPIFFQATRYFIIRAAEQQKLKLDYEMSGSIFSTLVIENLRATPTEPGPVEKLVINRLALRYSLWGLIRQRLPGFLESVEIEHADIVLNPDEKTPKDPKKKQSIKFPALFPRELRIADFNLLVRDEKGGELIVGRLFFTLNPDAPGELKVERLAIPGVHDWGEIAARTSYKDRNLVLTELSLGPEVFLRRLNLDASALSDGELRVALEGTMFSGRAKIEVAVTDLNKTNRLDAAVEAGGIELAEAIAYFNANSKLTGRLDTLAGSFSGLPDEPQTWTTEMRLVVEALAVAGVVVEVVKADVDLENGEGAVRVERLAMGANVATATMEVTLPAERERMKFLSAKGRMEVDAPNLGSVAIPKVEELAGSLKAAGTFEVSDGVVAGKFLLNGTDVRTPMVKAKTLEDVNFDFKKKFADMNGETAAAPAVSGSDYIRVANASPTPAPEGEESKKSPLSDLEFSLSGKATGVEVKGYEADEVVFDLDGKDGVIEVRKAEVTKGENTISAEGSYTVPDDPSQIDFGQADFKLKVSAPQLKDFVAEHTGRQLEGALDIDGDVRRANGKWNGHLSAKGSSLAFAGIEARSLAAEVDIKEDVAHIESLKVVFDDNNEVAAVGEVTLGEPLRYAGAVEATLNDLSIFQPALKKKPVAELPAEDAAALAELGEEKIEPEKPEPKLGGALSLTWSGEGTLKPHSHRGELQLGAKDLVFNATTIPVAKLEGKYSPELWDFPVFEVAVGETALTATLEAENGKLRIKEILLKQAGQAVLTGFAFLPFHPEALGNLPELVPLDERIAVNLNAKDLDLPKLLGSFGQEAPVTGTVSLRLTAGGTLEAPVGNLFTEGRKLQATAVPKLKPADFNLRANYRPGALVLDATINQGDLQPITIKGNVPLDLRTLAKDKQLDQNLPVDLTVKMPPSSLAFITEVAPAVRYLEGTAAIDAAVKGTVANPVFSGSATLNLPAIRMKAATAPGINDFRGELNFTGNTLTINRFGGVISGGPFNLQGKLIFDKLTEPSFDLRLAARNALLVRNSSVTVRADADVKIVGPFAAATVSGTVGLVNSRFYREVDILPLQLPGKPAPKPPPSPGKTVSITFPPVRDWNFDVAIVTKEPFKIRGNLANGAAFVDLRLIGTGLEPALDGTVRMENFVASLPFSKLEVTRGYVYFSPNDPFTPILDIQGSSRMRDYDLSVYIYGTASAPETLFSSQPPLPQEDIISLIGTGTTTEELASGGDALAGRAAVLLFQKLYRSVFKKKEPTEDESFLDRIEVSVGGVDPQTGQQEATARFKLGQNFYLIGEVGVGGSVTGKVTYLLRFK